MDNDDHRPHLIYHQQLNTSKVHVNPETTK